MAADRIALTDPPPRCSGCFQQKPQEPHVDFGAAWDGPMVPAIEGAVGVVGHSIDDLVLCETCIATAAKLLGYEQPGALVAERDQLQAGNDVLRARLRGLEEYVTKLEAAVAAKPEQPKRPAAKRGKVTA